MKHGADGCGHFQTGASIINDIKILATPAGFEPATC
jgi:hypothetical protein